MAKWFYLVDGQEGGPLEPADLRRLAASGQIKLTDQLRREDMAQWFQAKQVQGLFAASRPKAAPSGISTSPRPPIAPAPDGPIMRVPIPQTRESHSRLTYGALTVGVVLFLVGYLLKRSANATFVALIPDLVITGTIWGVVLGLIALVPAAGRVKKRWLPIFSWLLVAAAVFEVGVGAYTKFIVEPKLKEVLAALDRDTNFTSIPQKAADMQTVSTEPARSSMPRAIQFTPDDDRPRRQEMVIFNTTGHKNANGLRMKISHPATWKAEEGSGPATVQRLISDGGKGNKAVLIQTWALPKPFDRELTETEKRAYLERVTAAMDDVWKQAFGGKADVKFHKIGKLNDETCMVAEVESIIEPEGQKIGMKALVFIMLRNGVQLMLNCYVQGDASRGVDAIWREYESAKPIFIEIVESRDFYD